MKRCQFNEERERDTYLEDIDFASGAIDVELAVGWVLRIDTLSSQKVDNVLLTIFIAIGSRDLSRNHRK